MDPSVDTPFSPAANVEFVSAPASVLSVQNEAPTDTILAEGDNEAAAQSEETTADTGLVEEDGDSSDSDSKDADAAPAPKAPSASAVAALAGVALGAAKDLVAPADITPPPTPAAMAAKVGVVLPGGTAPVTKPETKKSSGKRRSCSSRSSKKARRKCRARRAARKAGGIQTRRRNHRLEDR